MNSKCYSWVNQVRWSLIVLLVGCGAQVTPQVETVGEISLDGVPVERAQVYLSARALDKKTPGTYGASVVAGMFEFPKHQGLPPGEYELIVKPIEEDPEEVFERMRKNKRKALARRDQFLSAVARKGPIRVELSSDELNAVTINLTTR